MKVRKIDMFIMKYYNNYSENCINYKEKQLNFKDWKDNNLKFIVAEYIKQRRLTRHAEKS